MNWLRRLFARRRNQVQISGDNSWQFQSAGDIRVNGKKLPEDGSEIHIDMGSGSYVKARRKK